MSIEKAANDRLIDDRELAKLFGLAPQTPRSWRHRGKGPRYVRLGAGPNPRIRYWLSDVGKYLDANTVETTDVAAASG